MMGTVLVYKTDLLPYSETFIKEQALAYQRWKPILVGHHRVAKGVPLDGLEVRLLLNDPPGTIEELLWRIRRLRGTVSGSEVRRLTPLAARLLHAHFGTGAVDIWPLARALALPMVVTLHGYDIGIRRERWEAGCGGFRRRTYPRKLLALAEEPRVHFVAVSEAIRQRAIDFGISGEKITVCHIGIDTERFSPGDTPLAERRRRVLFVGRLVEKKGVSHLINAFSRASHDISDAELLIIGDGPLRTSLERQAQASSAKIRFLGARNSTQVKQELDRARVFCLPSVTAADGDMEGFGMVLLESQACGVPVITSSIGAKDVGLDHGVTGFFFEPGDESALASHIRELLTDDQLAESMSRCATAFVNEFFSINTCSRCLEDVYERMAIEPQAHSQ